MNNIGNLLFASTIVLSISLLASTESNDLALSIRTQVESIFSREAAEEGYDMTNVYFFARGGGLAHECMNDEFKSFCTFVSNNCGLIAANWKVCETNEMLRFATLSAIGFSGFDNMTNFANKVLSLHELRTIVASEETIERIYTPDDPPDATHYLDLAYDNPGISNLVLRIKAIANSMGLNSLSQSCDETLSGERKKSYLNMKNAGAL